MDRTKVRGAVGFAMRAGKLATGDFAAEKAVKSGKARAALLDAGASDNTRDKYSTLCTRMNVPLYEMDDLGGCIGKEGRMVAAVLDGGFAKMICGAYASET